MRDVTASETALQAIVIAAYPELKGSRFEPHRQGWDSVALDVDDRLIFKFPRHAEAEAALVREARLLAVIRPSVTQRVPALMLHAGPPVFSRPDQIPGAHRQPEDYAHLTGAARAQLAADMARFFAELHAVDRHVVAAAGTQPIRPWLGPDEILRRSWPVLPVELRARAAQAVAEWQRLPADPHGMTFGYFDGHGWNMAFDHQAQRLNGVYDFGDSGFGALHQEFIYPNLVSPDLTTRIIADYEALTSRRLDRLRIHLLTTIHRLTELAEYAGHPDHAPVMTRMFADWIAR